MKVFLWWPKWVMVSNEPTYELQWLRWVRVQNYPLNSRNNDGKLYWPI